MTSTSQHLIQRDAEPVTTETRNGGQIWYRVGGATVAIASPSPMKTAPWENAWTFTLLGLGAECAGGMVVHERDAREICGLFARTAARAVPLMTAPTTAARATPRVDNIEAGCHSS